MRKVDILKINTLIIAESWPSVVIGLENNTASKLWINCPTVCPVLVKLLPSHTSWIGNSESARLAREDVFETCILQGSASFCERVLTSFGQDLNKEKLMFVLPAERLRAYKSLSSSCSKWYRIKHESIGGITNSKWLIGVGKNSNRSEYPPVNKLCATVGLIRQFMDILKTATRGQVCEPPEKAMPKLVTIDSVLRRATFRVPCVMSRSGWVNRPLTIQELGAVFDFPELFMARLGSDQEGLNDNELEAIFNSTIVPLKVVGILKCLIGSLQGQEEQVEVVEVSASLAVKESSVDFISGLLQDPNNGDIAKETALDVTANFLKGYGEKVAKSDNAAVPVELWNAVLFEKHFSHIAYSPVKHGRALEIIRNKFALRIYTINVVSSFFKFIKKNHGHDWLKFYLDTRRRVKGKLLKRKRGWKRKEERFQSLRADLAIGMEGLVRVIQGSWWEWDYGSTLFFWRWPIEIREAARDGLPAFIQSDLPRYRRRQRPPDKEYMLVKMKEKLGKVTKRKYISKGVVRSLINCFAVEKGTEDIRLVYDGTKSKLNDAVFAPNFFLPFLDSVLMWVNADSWLADLDLGEMFLNYFLDKRIRAYSGVDLTKFVDNAEEAKSNWERWNRTFMGFTFSPYAACKLFGWTVDVINGDRWDKSNPYRWDNIKTNFPGSENYDPTQPRLCKRIGELIAAILEVFVDDIRTIGPTMDHCRSATRRASQLLQYLGQQDAARKYRPPHTTPGPWCGSFIAIRDRCVWGLRFRGKME